MIDDSYNANPSSMRAAFQLLAQTEPKGGRRIAVLGDMLELGQEAEAMHRRLAPALREASDLVFACGPHMARSLKRCRHRCAAPTPPIPAPFARC